MFVNLIHGSRCGSSTRLGSNADETDELRCGTVETSHLYLFGVEERDGLQAREKEQNPICFMFF